MRSSTLIIALSTASLTLASIVLSACSKAPDAKATPTKAPDAKNSDDHAHDHAHDDASKGHDHAHDDAKADGHDHGHGPAMHLGDATVEGYTLSADRDAGEVKPGGEIAADVTITGTPAPSAVRLWVGTEDAKGSVKARAEIEDPAKAPTRWHTHVELPSPMAAGARLWVEFEVTGGRRVTTSFPLQK